MNKKILVLVIEIEKEEHLKQVLEKIEKKYPEHRWNYTCNVPTSYIPKNANYIYIYDDNTITYSEKRCVRVEKIVTSSGFLKEDEKKSDNVNHPQHYQGKNECIDVMVAMFGVKAVKHFCMCNAYKYRFRANMKNGEEDIRKAEWYESKLISLESKENK